MAKYDPDEFFNAERKCHAYSNEKNWLGEIGVCNGTKEREPCSCGGDEQKCDFYAYVRKRARKKPTNADRIRGMSDEELAECLRDIVVDSVRMIMFTHESRGIQEWLDWLKQEVET